MYLPTHTYTDSWMLNCQRNSMWTTNDYHLGKLIKCTKDPEIRKSKEFKEKRWGFIIISEEREVKNGHSNKLEEWWS